jgi:hypothetical protein
MEPIRNDTTDLEIVELFGLDRSPGKHTGTQHPQHRERHLTSRRAGIAHLRGEVEIDVGRSNAAQQLDKIRQQSTHASDRPGGHGAGIPVGDPLSNLSSPGRLSHSLQPLMPSSRRSPPQSSQAVWRPPGAALVGSRSTGPYRWSRPGHTGRHGVRCWRGGQILTRFASVNELGSQVSRRSCLPAEARRRTLSSPRRGRSSAG